MSSHRSPPASARRSTSGSPATMTITRPKPVSRRSAAHEGRAVKLVLVDYGAGNVGSVTIAFERLKLEPILTADLDEIASADRLIIPGVGAAGEAMAELRKRGLVGPLRALTQPVL